MIEFRHPWNSRGYIIRNKYKELDEFHISIPFTWKEYLRRLFKRRIIVDDYDAKYLCKVKQSFRHKITKYDHIIIVDVIEKL